MKLSKFSSEQISVQEMSTIKAGGDCSGGGATCSGTKDAATKNGCSVQD